MKILRNRILGALAIFIATLFAFGMQSWGAPAFTAHPARNQIAEENAPVTFTAAAQGIGELNYQWLRDGLPIAGANGSTLTLAGVQYSDRGFYQVRVADSTGVSRSRAAFLNVRVPNEIVAWGDYVTPIPAGLSDVLAVDIGYDREVASGAENYLALKSDGSVAGWGAAGPVPAGLIDVVAIASGGHHSLALKSDGTVVGWQNSLSHNNFSPNIVPAGLSGVVAIAAGSNSGIALKEDGTAVSWGQRPFDYPAVIAISAGQGYTLALKLDGTLLSNFNPLDITPFPPPPFQGTATGIVAISDGGFRLALKSDGTAISNGFATPDGLSGIVAISAGLRHGLALKADQTVVAWDFPSRTFTVLPAGLAGVIAIKAGNSSSFAITRIDKPVITVQPQPPAQTLGTFSPVTYHVSATGGVLSYQWKKDGVAIAGATTNSFSIDHLASFDSGTYTVTVSNRGGSVTSNAATLLTAGPAVTKEPEPSQIASFGESFTMSASATGSGTLTYQWLHNGLPVTGATGSSITVASTQYNDRGYYQVKITDAFGTVLSKAGFLNVLVPGIIRSWGANPEGVNTPPTGLSGVVALSRTAPIWRSNPTAQLLSGAGALLIPQTKCQKDFQTWSPSLRETLTMLRSSPTAPLSLGEKT